MHMHLFKALLIMVALGMFGAIVFVWTGIFHPAADEPHWPLTYRLMETTRDRSISVRTSGMVVPPLDDPALIRQGAGNYNAMCSGCHLGPGMADTELHKGLYPAPPNLTELGVKDPARTFWVIKHGMKMSGMPAWGKSMQDPYIWGMVAFLQRLPTLTPEQYKALSAGGHHHDGGETHSHEDMEESGHRHDEPTGEGDHDHPTAGSGKPAHQHGGMPMEGMQTGREESGHSHATPSAGTPAGNMNGMKMPGDTHSHFHDQLTKSMQGMDHSNMPGMKMDAEPPAQQPDGQSHGGDAMQGMNMGAMQTPAAKASHADAMSGKNPKSMQHQGMQGMAGMKGTDHAGMAGMDMGGMQGMDHAGMAIPKPARVIGPAEAAVKAFHDAQEIGNTNLAMQWLASDLVVEEDGHSEHSRAEYAASHLGADIAFLKASRVRMLQSSALMNGNTATVTSHTRITSLPGHKPADVISQETATLRKTAEGWRIVHLQWVSTPAPTDAPAPQHH